MTPRPPFLDILSDADSRTLNACMTVRRYGKGEMVISVAEDGRDVFFVLEGRAHAVLHSADGKAVDYREIRTGDMFGELAAIDGEPRSASVVAQDPARIGRLSHAAFQDLVDNHRSFAWTLLAHLSTQIRHMTDRIFEYSTLLVRERLVRELLRLAVPRTVGPFESAYETGTDSALRAVRAEIHPAPTHFDLAARISTHREAVSREMSALAKQGLLEKRSGILHLHDVDALRALCPDED